MYRTSKHPTFHEEDITHFSRERLKRIAYHIVFNPCGWRDYIDNLEMVVIDERIIVRGWATTYRWKKFTRKAFEDVSNCCVYDKAIDRYYESIGYGKERKITYVMRGYYLSVYP